MLDSLRLTGNPGSDPDLDILAACHEKWERTPPGQRDAVVLDYCVKYPHVADRLRSLLRGVAIVSEMKDPERLGPYRIDCVLGVGGMGKVYEAEDEILQRRVAVKTIRLGRLAQGDLMDRFLNERESLARLHHSNIVPIYGAGEQDGLLYFAMPKLAGTTLAGLIKTAGRQSPGGGSTTTRRSWEALVEQATSDETTERNRRLLSDNLGVTPVGNRSRSAGKLSPAPGEQDVATGVPRNYVRQVVEILAVVAEAVHSAHEANILHRDLKPSNILVEPTTHQGTTSWHPWVLDFGLAHDLVMPQGGSFPGAEPTLAEMACPSADSPSRGPGTRGYMAPEQLLGRAENGGTDRTPSATSGAPEDPTRNADAPVPRIDRYTDVWSLGVTLYELLTFRLPFVSEAQVFGADPPPPPREFVPDLSSELEAVCLKALEKQPAKRYATAAELATDLRRWLDGVPTVAGHANVLERSRMWARRRPAAAFAAGMTVAFLVVAVLGAKNNFDRIKAREAQTRAEADATRSKLEVVDQRARASQQQLELLGISRKRSPIREIGWFEDAWSRVRKLAAAKAATDDNSIQGQAAASFINMDARVVKSLKMVAQMLAFDPTGKRLLMASEARDAKGELITVVDLWDERKPPSPRRDFRSLGVIAYPAADTPLLLSWEDNDRQASLILNDALTGQPKQTIRSPLADPSRITSISLSRDGSRAAGIVWPLRKEQQPGKGETLVPDGNTATIAVWSTRGELVTRFESNVTRDSDLVLSPDGSLVAVWDLSGQRREVEVWSTKDGRRITAFSTDRTKITSVVFGRDPVWHDDDARTSPWCLAVGTHGGMITVWDIQNKRVRSLCRGSKNEVSTLDFSPDGALLASAGRDDVRLWNTATGACVLTIPSASHQLAVNFSPDGQRLAAAQVNVFAGSTDVQIFELDLGRGMRTLSGLQQRVEKLAVSNDGRRVAALSNDWQIGVWDRATGALVGILDAPVGLFTDNTGLALNADGTRLVCSAGTEAKLWDLESRRLLARWTLPPALTEAPAFRADGQPILVRQETRTGQLPASNYHPKLHPRVCRLYELSVPGKPKVIKEIGEFDWHVLKIAMQPDGAHFAIEGLGTSTGQVTRLVRLYEGRTGTKVGELATSFTPKDEWKLLDFTPNGTRLIVALDRKPEASLSAFEVPSLKLDRLIPNNGGSDCNEGLSLWVLNRWSDEEASESLLLQGAQSTRPLLRIVLDVRNSVVNLSPEGDRLIWGGQDGSVVVSDLVEVQRRLADVGLGW